MPTSRKVLFGVAIVFLLIAGTGVRLAPLSSDQRTIASITEDGYLMLTVARNVALGRSLSIAEGTILTNGVQPLVTLAWAGVHRLSDSDRLAALRSVVVIQFAIAVLTAVFVGLLARETFRAHPWRDVLAVCAACLWFASPLALRHTSNGLETGPYVCALAATLLIDLRWRGRSAVRSLVLGASLGVLFLIRNDAVFFAMAFLLTDLLKIGVSREGDCDDAGFRRRLLHVTTVAVTALAVASPWLIYNARIFGHIVPVSGRAQNLNLQIGENLSEVPRVLAEYALSATPLPAALSAGRMWPFVCAFVLLGAVILTVRQARLAGCNLNRWMTLVLVHAALLCVYYGVFFGAAYFLSRYLFPLSLISVLLPCFWLMPSMASGRTWWSGTTLGGLLIAMSLTLLVLISARRFYAASATHDHAHVVQWVSEHLDPRIWVGAPQSGTLGYFHDRTINLDGKVNPQALQARRDNRLFRYIVEDTPVDYLADWYGLARWMDRPETIQEEEEVGVLSRHFTVILRDPDRNLVVLRRNRALQAE